MKTLENKTIYTEPQISKIVLDHEISLQLQSAPPNGPGEPVTYAPEYFIQEPFGNV